MPFVKRAFHWAWRALFLEQDVYEDMRDDDNPFVEGLFIVVVISVAIALFSLVGTALARAATPDLQAMKQTVLNGLRSMPWFDQMLQAGGQQALDMFNQFYDLGWQIFPRLAGYPDIGNAALNLVLLPVTMILLWLLWGVVAHVVARLLGGKGTLSQTLGATALAEAPQLLSLVTVIPFVVVGGVIGTWRMLCRYTALKTVHGLSWPRAVAATLLPGILFGILIAVLGFIFSTLLMGLVAGGIAQ
ncbi:Yip1 family protein [Candidatus Amarolinea dominans]|uniref:Yip1 family protein n=1 Tax=Candidatus Amarolinea dominans TaxID=3140696 RepID=UPI00313660A0|nr:YIP1 family protein [Anaerolineae bacterium]